jgi:hypothetical protein
LPKKPNYDYEKRKKELDRKTKKDAKLARKRENAANRAEGGMDESGADVDGGALNDESADATTLE